MTETLRAYVPKRFSPARLAAIGGANNIIQELAAKGYALTLRQLYYQHVARGLIENSLASYNNLGSLINDARLAGLISWTAIEDRTRALAGLGHYRGPADALNRALASYRLDLWVDQPWRPEVWVEKEALVDVVGQICNRLRVDYFACRGYVSQSTMWEAGQRLRSRISAGQRPIIFHLGDHDPSGIDMTRDNKDRLEMFAGTQVTVVRLALNMNQIEQYNPPPNPAKVSDARFVAYDALYGGQSWELDALDPSVISDLISDAIKGIRDEVLYDEALKAEASDRVTLEHMIENL